VDEVMRWCTCIGGVALWFMCFSGDCSMVYTCIVVVCMLCLFDLCIA
jgi:hypothetical protein